MPEVVFGAGLVLVGMLVYTAYDIWLDRQKRKERERLMSEHRNGCKDDVQSDDRLPF